MPLIFIMVKNTDYTDYFMYLIGIAVGYFVVETLKQTTPYQKKLIAAFIFIFMYFVFNSIYEQSGGSLSLFAKDNLVHNLLGFGMDPNVINNSANSFSLLFSVHLSV
jgi:POT family proton-dependent oligopeptide transporter